MKIQIEPRSMRGGSTRALLLAGLALLLAACASRQDPMVEARAELERIQASDWNHLSGMPQPQAVVARIGDRDPLIALVRQCQALSELHYLLADSLVFAPEELGPLPAAAATLRDSYRSTIDRELLPRFRQLLQAQRPGTDVQQAWNLGCKGESAAWEEYNIDAGDWLELIAQPARGMADTHHAWYEKSMLALAASRAGAASARAGAAQARRLTCIGIGALILLLGASMMRRGWRIQRQLDKYEFENRNEAGVVQFASHEDMLRHRRRKYGANQFLYLGGGIIAIAGAITMIVGFTL